MTILDEKLENIKTTIDEIKEVDPAVAQILLDSFGCALNLIVKIVEKGDSEVIDLSEQIQMVSEVLGFDLEKIVEHILQKAMSTNEESSKQADEATLDFITSDLDDYEKFLAANKAKESLDFLKNQL